MSSKIVETIKKLLRVAAAVDGAEGMLARERAERLMERYGVNVSVDDCKVALPGVVGVFWREATLAAIASKHRCKVLRGMRDGQVVAILAGEQDDVETARDLYDYLFLEVTRAFVTSFGNDDALAFSDLDMYSDAPADVYRKNCQAVWTRAFLTQVSRTLPGRFLDPDKPTPPAAAPSETARRGQAEIESLAKDVESLGENIGRRRAQELGFRACKAAIEAMTNLNWQWRTCKLLTATSTVPKPVESRWTRLDVDVPPPQRSWLRSRL